MNVHLSDVRIPAYVVLYGSHDLCIDLLLNHLLNLDLLLPVTFNEIGCKFPGGGGGGVHLGIRGAHTLVIKIKKYP